MENQFYTYSVSKQGLSFILLHVSLCCELVQGGAKGVRAAEKDKNLMEN
jgi:hypothetical protein